MHHWLTNRIVVHVKICVLALLIERTIELNCDQPWRQIKETLAFFLLLYLLKKTQV